MASLTSIIFDLFLQTNAICVVCLCGCGRERDGGSERVQGVHSGVEGLDNRGRVFPLC